MTLQPPLQVDAEKQILDLEERRLAMAEILNWDLEITDNISAPHWRRNRFEHAR